MIDEEALAELKRGIRRDVEMILRHSSLPRESPKNTRTQARRAELRVLWSEGVGAEEIATRLGYKNAPTVRATARTLGLGPRRP